MLFLFLIPFLEETVATGSFLPPFVDFKSHHNRDTFDKHFYKEGRAFHLEQRLEVTPTKLIVG
jgi:hypothetical protein